MCPRARSQDGGSMQTVRVATFAGPGEPPVIREVPKPEVPPKAALIRVAACGVCGTDLHILKGHWPRPLPWPFTLGHELVGVVEEIGGELTEDFMGRPLEVGSKVMLPPLMPCGSCYYCARSRAGHRRGHRERDRDAQRKLDDRARAGAGQGLGRPGRLFRERRAPSRAC